MSKKLAKMNPRQRIKWLMRQCVTLASEIEDDAADTRDEMPNLYTAIGKIDAACVALQSARDSLGYYKDGHPPRESQPRAVGRAGDRTSEPVPEPALGWRHGEAFRDGDVVCVTGTGSVGTLAWAGMMGVVRGTYMAQQPGSVHGLAVRYYRVVMRDDGGTPFDFLASELEAVRYGDSRGQNEDDPPTVEVTRDLLLLAGVQVDVGVIEAWSDEQRDQAAEWAGAIHLRASDNEGVAVPARPAWVPDPASDEQRALDYQNQLGDERA